MTRVQVPFVAAILIAAFMSSASAQEDRPCGNLPEVECGYLNAAVDNWNALFGERVKFMGWKANCGGSTDYTDVLEGKALWLPTPGDNGSVVGAAQVGS